MSTTCCIPCLFYVSVSLNGKPVTVHETNYDDKTYLEKLLNYGSDASGTHLVSSFWYLESTSALKDNTGYARRLNYLSSGQNLDIYLKAPC